MFHRRPDARAVQSGIHCEHFPEPGWGGARRRKKYGSSRHGSRYGGAHGCRLVRGTDHCRQSGITNQARDDAGCGNSRERPKPIHRGRLVLAGIAGTGGTRVRALRRRGPRSPTCGERTGLVLDPYFIRGRRSRGSWDNGSRAQRPQRGRARRSSRSAPSDSVSRGAGLGAEPGGGAPHVTDRHQRLAPRS